MKYDVSVFFVRTPVPILLPYSSHCRNPIAREIHGNEGSIIPGSHHWGVPIGSVNDKDEEDEEGDHDDSFELSVSSALKVLLPLAVSSSIMIIHCHCSKQF